MRNKQGILDDPANTVNKNFRTKGEKIMKKYAVGVINFFDNELKIEIVDADSVKSALSQHSEIVQDDDQLEWLNDMGDNLSDMKSEFFNGDMMVDVVEIP